MITDDEAKKLIREMFDDEVLDPYPTSDNAPEYLLKYWCGYEKDASVEELAPPPDAP